MKKVPLILTIILVTLMCFPATALAETDFEYNGEIDNFTGQPVITSTNGDTDTGTVQVSSTVYYDTAKHMFLINPKSQTGKIYASVVDGMMTTQSVSFTLDGVDQAQLYKDGKLVENPDLLNIFEVGKYILKIGSPNNSASTDINFTILNKKTGAVNRYNIPSGFFISDVIFNDENIAFSPSYISLSEEGKYEITYSCYATNIRYDLDVTIDHTAPVLALEAVKDGKADGPVSLADAEEGSRITILHDDKEMDYDAELTESGTYHISITDEAGNSRSYDFTILVYFNINSFVFIALILLAFVGMIVYLWRSKTHLRVR